MGSYVATSHYNEGSEATWRAVHEACRIRPHAILVQVSNDPGIYPTYREAW